MKLYMAVTPDIYELPIAVETSPALLAKRIGMSKKSILPSINRTRNKEPYQGQKTDKSHFCRLRMVCVEDEDEDG